MVFLPTKKKQARAGGARATSGGSGMPYEIVTLSGG